MFSPKTISSALDRWSQQPGNFIPVRHTLSDCDRAVAHFNTLISFDPETETVTSTRDPGKDWRATLKPDEIQFIRNERILCRCDFSYWFLKYCYIKNEEDRVVHPLPWISQQIFLDILSEMEADGFEVAVLLLKARQLGMSAVIARILLHGVIWFPNVNAFMASADETKTNLLFDMADFTLAHLPFWMQPGEKFRREGKLLELHNGSRITLQHGQQNIGIGRGTTPTLAHISEVAEFDNPEDLIDSSLLRAMHPSARTKIFLEGTAKGMNNWWHHTWLDSKSGWLDRRSRLRPLFLPWFVGGLYPKEIDLRKRPVPADYPLRMAPWAEQHAKMAREYVLKTDYLLKRLGSNWQMPIEQIWYYECERETAIRKNKLNKFLQEMPANDDEAFQSTSISVFDTDTITFYRDNAHSESLQGVYGLAGSIDHIAARHQPSHLLVDPDKAPIDIRCNRDTGYPCDFQLVPLRFQGWSLEPKDGLDRIYVWEHPVPGETYGFGVDTSDGIDKDRTVIECIRKYSLNGPTKQVVELASGKMNAIDSWPFLLALGTYYSQPDDHGHIQQPRMAIECAGHGDMPQNIIRMMGWRNFHPWNDKQLDARIPRLDQYNKIGVYTRSGWFRDGMIELLVKLLRDGDIEICSPHFVQEMTSLQGDEMIQSLRAGYGGHDDRIMALGFILVSLYKWDTDYFRSARIAAYSGRSPVNKEPPPKVYAQWAYNWAERNDTGIYLSSPSIDDQPQGPTITRITRNRG
jgi:hypothetical protein